ncbi:MAG: hypothetical protein K6F92_08070 [Lachnospiraceae bacterium]|nr:hypothetical protein [Lachnospiraceae bacterium]
MKLKRHYWLKAIISLGIILFCGYLKSKHFRSITMQSVVKDTFVYFVYLGMVVGWGISFNKRIKSYHINKFLNLIIVFMCLWLFIRSVKFYLPSNDDVPWKIMIWYCYYIPMITIPVLEFYAVLYLHKPETYKIDRRWYLLLPIAIILCIGILTNNYHQLAFGFDGKPNDTEHSYEILYYIIFVYIGILTLASVVIIITKCQLSIKGYKRFTPFIFLILFLLYVYGYNTKSNVSKYIELIIAYNWSLIMMWETCVQLDMIPVNKYQKEFFDETSIKAMITDVNGNILDASSGVIPLNSEELKALKVDQVLLNGKQRYHLYPINCGYLIWQEDVRDLFNLIEQLKSDEQELNEANTLIQEEIRARNRQEKFRETNRIYNMLMTEMEGALVKIENLTDEAKNCEDDEELKRLISHINLIGVYLKRRSNLIMIAEGGEKIDRLEIDKCFNETFENLKLCGTYAQYSLNFDSTFPKDAILEAYDYLQKIMELNLFKAKTMTVSMVQKKKKVTLNILVDDKEKYVFDVLSGGVA